MTVKPRIFNYAEYLRSFEVIPSDNITIFLGAGTSISAGIPSAGAMTWEFKRKLYCSELKINEERFKDIESESNRRELQEYFDSKGGFPPRGNPAEYSYYFEKCYPNSRDRKLYIQKKVENQNPSIGHLCLGALITSGKIKNVWTTNFDGLVEAGINKIQAGFSYSVFSPENSGCIPDVHSPYPKLLKLHGDYRYDSLQNTSTETQQLEALIQKEFVEIHKNRGIIVVGYSGNDLSILDAIKKVIESKGFPYGLTWCIRKGEQVNQNILELVSNANKYNNCSGFVEIDGFDDYLHDLYCISRLSNPIIDGLAEKLFKKRRPFLATQANMNYPHIKLNGLKITGIPRSVYEFEADITGWKELKELTKDKVIISSLSRGKVYCFGDINEIKNTFSKKIKSQIIVKDIQDSWLYHDYTFYIGMLYKLIAYAFISKLDLCQVKYFNRFYDTKSVVRTENGNKDYDLYDAIEIDISFIAGNLYLNITPSVEVVPRNGIQLSRSDRQWYINKSISQWYNIIFSQKLDLWLKKLGTLGNPINICLDRFQISIDPQFVFAGHKIGNTTSYFEGVFEKTEPTLQFHTTDNHYSTVHPLLGLSTYGPLDLSYNSKQYGTPVKLGIISFRDKFPVLIKHLTELKNELQPKSEKDYLKTYPGFDKVFKRYIDIPSNIDNKYVVPIEVQEVKGISQIEFYNLIKKKIDHFYTLRGDIDLLVLYIPNEFRDFRETKNDSMYFDLHDSIKLYCAKRHIKVQIIEDKSITYFDQSKVKWWLSLGIYAKANGIPWKLSSGNNSTAYIGLGYAIQKCDSNRIVMGCSQLFDSSGQGLRFMLQQIYNPIYKGKNPFMSKEDARRIVSSLKEAYFKMDPNAKLERLVIHKTTFFTNDEMEGIALALEGIPQVELLQIQQICPWRAIRKHDTKREPHGYPIKRGTTIQLDEYTFLLWTHGSVCHDDLAGRRMNYYQGARGVPMPLMVRRFRGEDPIEKTSKEILELTKMNWNGAELYKKLPVTIDFSKRLSQMAKQIESLNNEPYDFRYFI